MMCLFKLLLFKKKKKNSLCFFKRNECYLLLKKSLFFLNHTYFRSLYFNFSHPLFQMVTPCLKFLTCMLHERSGVRVLSTSMYITTSVIQDESYSKKKGFHHYLLPPKTQFNINGITLSIKNLPPTLPGCGIRNLVKNCKWKKPWICREKINMKCRLHFTIQYLIFKTKVATSNGPRPTPRYAL